MSVAACDVSDRDAVAELLAAVPAEHPLTGVVHLAGVLDDGVIGALTPERIAGGFGPKATALRHLDVLTREYAPGLKTFVVFSSAAALLGSAGQGNYAAANAFLDSVMARRRAAGRWRSVRGRDRCSSGALPFWWPRAAGRTATTAAAKASASSRREARAPVSTIA